MGKASRWIISMLLGKKDDDKENYKKNSIKASSNCNCNLNSIHAATATATAMTLKRRWSFGRSSRKEHKSPILKNVEPIMLALPGVETASLSSSTLARNAAAIKIQSAFRSHLARRALCALRGLVKLQALARGHIVRKQTASTLHRMHALMTIQVRARLQRLVKINAHQVQVVDDISSKMLHIPPARASFSFERQHYYADLTMSPDVPKYMVGTQSSRAKTAARSRSEPKQRPGWSIRHKTKSGNETGSVRLQLPSSHSNRMAHENDDPAWFVNLYESSTRSSSLDAYEPHLTLF